MGSGRPANDTTSSLPCIPVTLLSLSLAQLVAQETHTQHARSHVVSTWEARRLLSPSPTFLTATAGKAGPSQPPLVGLQGKQPPAALVFPFTAPGLSQASPDLPSSPLATTLLHKRSSSRVWWEGYKLVNQEWALLHQQEVPGPHPPCQYGNLRLG